MVDQLDPNAGGDAGADAGGGVDTGADAGADAGNSDAGNLTILNSDADSGAGAGDNAGGDDGANDGAQSDWRSELAGDDKALAGFLGRYASVKALVEAAKKDRDTIRKGVANKLPDNPSDDELAAYRKEQGIPDAPEGYLDKLPDGIIVGDDDRPAVDAFTAAMHGVNAPKGVVDAALGAYYQIVDDQMAAQAEAEKAFQDEAHLTLRDEWGGDYRRNLNVINSFLEGEPESIRNLFSGGRDADGMPIGNNPDVLRWLAGKALEANPAATVVPGAGAQAANAIADEIATLEKRMGTDAWFKDDKAQARYMELLKARDKLPKA